MQDVLYEVFETDIDYTEIKLIHQGFHRDIAETVMDREFFKHRGQRDYMLVNHGTQDVIGLLLSDQTKALRGETR